VVMKQVAETDAEETEVGRDGQISRVTLGFTSLPASLVLTSTVWFASSRSLVT
jgi:hypothetical protein